MITIPQTAAEFASYLLEGVATAERHAERLTERTTFAGGRVDTARGVIQGVKVLGAVSRNGRTYSDAAIRQAASKYEGVKVNINHTDRPDAMRNYEDRIGSLRNVRVESDGLYADLHFNPKHSIGDQLAWDAEHAPENVGLSHNVIARTSRRGGGVVVEEIQKVLSVDLVADPATTAGLFESVGGSDIPTDAAGFARFITQ